MFRNFLISTFRSLFRNKLHSTVNVFGLSIGFSCSLVLFLLVSYTLSYNTFEANYDNIYRLVSSTKGQGGETYYTMAVPIPLPEAVRNDFPEFKEVIYTQSHYGEMLFEVNRDGQPKYFELREERLVFTDPGYFDVFTVNVLQGDVHSALDLTGGTVISKSMADRLFPGEEPLGKEIKFNKELNLVVKAIIEDQTPLSDMPFDFYVSTHTIQQQLKKEGSWNSWSSDNQCYVLLSEEDKPKQYTDRIGQFVLKYFTEAEEEQRTLWLQPLSDLHYSEHYSNYNYRTTEQRDIIIMLTVGIFLLLSAVVNFVNLSTAVAAKRSREIGVRKVLGSSKTQLVLQFLMETLIISTFALIIGIGLAEVLILYLNPMLETALFIDYFNPQFLLALLAGLSVVTILAGAYPSFILANYRPVLALKGGSSKHSGSGNVRKGLVVFQFFVSQVLIISTIIHISQMNLINEKDLGFRTEALMDVRIPENDSNKSKTLKNELLALPGVDQVSLTFSNPTSGSVSFSNFYFDDNPEDFGTAMKFADDEYLDIYDIELLAGRSYGASDTLNEVVVNETLLKEVGFEGTPQDAVGKIVRVWGQPVPIVGVIKDFHSTSLRHKITGIMIFSDANAYQQATLSVNLANFQQTNKEIAKIWKSFYPEYNYEYTFFDQYLLEFYESIQHVADVMTFFTLIAILIGCLGLFGLASFMANQKVKEVGVRKVLGATVQNILVMYTWSFSKLIGLAFIFAVPLAYYGMDQWLNGFEYKVELSPVFFIVGLLVTTLIAIVTIGFRSYRAAAANPVDSLRSE